MSAIWIWGRHPVLEALRAGAARHVLLAAGRDSSSVLVAIREAARRQRVPVREADSREIARLAPGQNTQGVLAEIFVRTTSDVRELLAKGQSPTFILALDQIQDPHNLGALIRTAYAASATGVLLPDRNSAPFSGVVAKSSAGAISHVVTIRVPNLVRSLDDLRDAGTWVMGLDDGATTSIYDADLTTPLALVVGSEGHGLRRLTREHCDLLLRIPMSGRVASLNASVAGGVAMYEVVRQRLRLEPSKKP